MERQTLTFYQGEYTIRIHVAKCDRERLDFSFGQLHLKFVVVLILVSAATRSLKVYTINIRNVGICDEILENYHGRNSTKVVMPAINTTEKNRMSVSISVTLQSLICL